MKKVREELENVQRDLKLQTKRCRYLVAEYTRKLQEKEQLFLNEKSLRDTQLAKVLKALLIFEARLKQEQKLISHQLSEKDYIIKAQTSDIKKLLANTYCKNCNQYYPTSALESFDSSSEYVVTESSNLESLDSSSDTYRDYSTKSENESYEKASNKIAVFQKNKYNSHSGRRRKSTGTYFEVLKLRNESPISNEDNTSADYDHLDSLPPESISDKISVVSESIESMLSKDMSESSTNISSSDCNKTVINTLEPQSPESENNKLSETICAFAGGEANSDNNWYASASDQEDEEHSNVYRNNPVLECMNQILLQNISDINSPPKTPNIERKTHTKRVKFSDEEEKNCAETNETSNKEDYYETPIQKTPNFYETPQSIYSNDYEQILSKTSECSSECSKPTVVPRNSGEFSNESHHYIEMEKSQHPVDNRRNKIHRTPPALPPKPPNLISKGKIHVIPKKPPSELSSNGDLEPDYCSISELNLPPTKVTSNKISVVAEVHSPTTNEIKTRINQPTPSIPEPPPNKEEAPTLVVKKCVEKLNVQLAKQTPVSKAPEVSPNKKKVEIPKLPQVSEIIIPDDPDDTDEPIVSQDNYIKNSTQIIQGKSSHPRKPIVIGSSVSTLINGFNNNQLINEIKKRHERMKIEPKKVFSSFENHQNLDKPSPKVKPACFENFDLSQNFEEFKLDDCEIEEYDVEEEMELEEIKVDDQKKEAFDKVFSKRVDYIRATEQPLPSLNPTSLELLKKQLELRRSQNPSKDSIVSNNHSPSQPTYEHFLECTGLSSKSIITPSRGMTNHKHMLKPKDVKLRSKVRSSNSHVFEKHSGSKIRYWSEPFV